MKMSTYNLTYKPFGDISILIEWPSKIDPEIIQDIANFEKIVSKQQKVVETIIAYNSLTVRYKFMYNYSTDYRHRNDFRNTVKKLKELYAMERTQKMSKQRIWQVPVCYDLQFGIDLEEIAANKKLSIEEVIELHSTRKYLIYFLGFQPGFLYLGGLESKLHIPRRSNPRLRVEKGSVAIGGEQTGVYPQASSGGWNIVGKTPIDFFDISKSKSKSKSKPCFAKAGEFIQFKSVDLKSFNQISEEVHNGSYQLKFQWL